MTRFVRLERNVVTHIEENIPEDFVPEQDVMWIRIGDNMSVEVGHFFDTRNVKFIPPKEEVK